MSVRVLLLSSSLLACAADTFATNDGGTTGGEAGACPQIAGFYAVAATGLACPDQPDTSFCIKQSGCTIELDGQKFQGQITVGPDGSFTNATVVEGQQTRSGCVGNWDPKLSILTIDCGGVGTTQSCGLRLTRSAPVCP